jgi:hypothetical protein
MGECRLKVAAALVLALLSLLGCGNEDPQEERDRPIAYGIGVSTDPYGRSRPKGFGVVAELSAENPVKAERRGSNYFASAAFWLDDRHLVVPRARRRGEPPQLLRFRYRNGSLQDEGPIALRRSPAGFAWSPERDRIAYQPALRCELPAGSPSNVCYRPGGRIFVARGDGSDEHRAVSGGLWGWTPDGLLVYGRVNQLRTLDIETGHDQPLLSGRKARSLAPRLDHGLESPAWSRDGRYVAALGRLFYGRRTRRDRVSTIVVARRDGRVVNLVHSPYIISMYAWSPRRNRLAYTTSGFPEPHELFVIDIPGGKQRRIYATKRHFDWITWSPDGAKLLLDDEHAKRWRLIDASGTGRIQSFPRLGGRPLWCCPGNSYAGQGFFGQ